MKKQTNTKILFFLRKNALYLILTACILAVGFSITLMLVNKNLENSATVDPDVPVIINPVPDDSVGSGNTNETPEIPEPVVKPITFIMPVENSTDVGQYVETMVWNSTLNRYSAHLAIDFFADEGTPVLAVFDGTVESVENSLIHGVTITVDHGNGLKTVYNSLADGDLVVEGQVVKQGDVIGEVSVSNRQEYKEGAHLHFEVYENGIQIDPVKYLEFDEK